MLQHFTESGIEQRHLGLQPPDFILLVTAPQSVKYIRSIGPCGQISFFNARRIRLYSCRDSVMSNGAGEDLDVLDFCDCDGLGGRNPDSGEIGGESEVIKVSVFDIIYLCSRGCSVGICCMNQLFHCTAFLQCTICWNKKSLCGNTADACSIDCFLMAYRINRIDLSLLRCAAQLALALPVRTVHAHQAPNFIKAHVARLAVASVRREDRWRATG